MRKYIYKILEKIGEGGIGETYRGIDEMLEREVAIKLLHPEFAHCDDIVERFRIEAVSLTKLNHPNITTVYNFFQQEEQLFIVMKFVHGEALDKFIKQRGVIPWQEALNLICQALSGLEYAHKIGVIHRDVKPANMIFSNDNILKLMDFGIAHILEKSRLTRTDHFIGTLEYMSPEQIKGLDTDARSDIYSVGIVLYELLTSHVPFEEDSEYDLIKSQVEELPQPPRFFASDIPQELEDVVLRVLSKEPEQRIQSAETFRITLQNILSPIHSQQPTRNHIQHSSETRLDTQADLKSSDKIKEIQSSNYDITNKNTINSDAAFIDKAEDINQTSNHQKEFQTTSKNRFQWGNVKNYPVIIISFVLAFIAGVLIFMTEGKNMKEQQAVIKPSKLFYKEKNSVVSQKEIKLPEKKKLSSDIPTTNYEKEIQYDSYIMQEEKPLFREFLPESILVDSDQKEPESVNREHVKEESGENESEKVVPVASIPHAKSKKIDNSETSSKPKEEKTKPKKERTKSTLSKLKKKKTRIMSTFEEKVPAKKNNVSTYKKSVISSEDVKRKQPVAYKYKDTQNIEEKSPKKEYKGWVIETK